MNRRPLVPRQPLLPPVPPPPSVPHKRPRSPDPAALPPRKHRRDRDPARDLHRLEREQQRLEFKEKYCRAFPAWTFYLDGDTIDSPQQLESFRSRIQQLGAKIDPFFSRDTTHLISNAPNPPGSIDPSEKENAPKPRISSKSKSPLKSRSRQQEDADATELIANALKFKIKIWDTAKLDSVLSRCLEESPVVAPTQSISSKQRNPHTLSKLLQSERLHGSSERDPTQKRHDFHYFGRGSHFVLIEDMYGELATIATHEYPALKKADDDKTPWPTLYCHPQARGPFIRFDEREKRRWERLQQAEKKEREERQLRRETLLKKLPMEKKVNLRPLTRKAGDLRRSVSLNNMANADTFAFQVADHDGDGDAIESANASGYLASGFMGYTAASGNSVNITSTTGTTSASNYASRALQIPSNLSSRMRAEVVMRRQPVEKLSRTNTMGPPVDVPQRSMVLKKSKSTNTLKLPKREEGSKPGYCESCRQKFDDFKEHIRGRKHRKFAADDSNFLSLDYIIHRVERRTLEESQALHQRRFDICSQTSNPISNQDSDSDFDPIPIEDWQ